MNSEYLNQPAAIILALAVLVSAILIPVCYCRYKVAQLAISAGLVEHHESGAPTSDWVKP